MMNMHKWEKWAAIAAVVVMVVAIGLFAGQAAVSGSETVIALDVNPSIELEINKNEKITEVRALNEEAKIVLGEMDLERVDLDVAINAIIGSMLKNGYLSADQNSILISIDTKNKDKAEALKEKLTGEIDALLGGSQIDASVITQDFDRNGADSQKGEQNGISPAKAALISKIMDAGLLDANGVPYTYEVLAQLRVNELKLILESKELTVDGIAASGTAGGGGYITREAAVAAALARAGVAEADAICLAVEMDYEHSHAAKEHVMVYEIEFYAADLKYEYEIRAKDGTVLDEEIKPMDEDDREECQGGNGNGYGNGSGHHGNGSSNYPADCLDRGAVLTLVYADAGVTEGDVRRPEIELDEEKGVWVYEVEFKTADKEYEYTVNAVTGEILEREVERADD